MMNLWFFLSVGAVFGCTLGLVAVLAAHKRKMKRLEIESLHLHRGQLDGESCAATDKKLDELVSRLEILEAIVTDKNYELSEKIKQLKDE